MLTLLVKALSGDKSGGADDTRLAVCLSDLESCWGSALSGAAWACWLPFEFCIDAFCRGIWDALADVPGLDNDSSWETGSFADPAGQFGADLTGFVFCLCFLLTAKATCMVRGRSNPKCRQRLHSVCRHTCQCHQSLHDLSKNSPESFQEAGPAGIQLYYLAGCCPATKAQRDYFLVSS